MGVTKETIHTALNDLHIWAEQLPNGTLHLEEDFTSVTTERQRCGALLLTILCNEQWPTEIFIPKNNTSGIVIAELIDGRANRLSQVKYPKIIRQLIPR